MTLCVFDDGRCQVCGAPRINERQLCGTFCRENISKPFGPGTELSKLLKRFGIEPTPNCACREMAAQMDVWGPNECDRPERIDEVVAVMRTEAAARGLPFLDMVGRLLVKRAIQNARRNA
jgi:hypothetical protein